MKTQLSTEDRLLNFTTLDEYQIAKNFFDMKVRTYEHLSRLTKINITDAKIFVELEKGRFVITNLQDIDVVKQMLERYPLHETYLYIDSFSVEHYQI